MKGRFLGVLAMGIISLANLQANYGGDWCCHSVPSIFCGTLEVGGQWIYLRPTSCDYDCVIKDGRPFNNQSQASIDEVIAQLPSGKSKGVKLDYESGFRVSVGYTMDCTCYDLRAEYTYHHPTERSIVFGSEATGLWPTCMHPRYARNIEDSAMPPNPAFETPIHSGIGELTTEFINAQAKNKVKLDYDSVDLQFGFRSVRGCNLWLRTYAGLHFMNLDQKQAVEYVGKSHGEVGGFPDVAVFETDVKWTKNTWGIGPLFGIDARYQLACGFGIGGHIGAAILAGETHGKFFERDFRSWDGTAPPTDVNEEAKIEHDDRSLLFPYLRARLGVNYLWCCSDCFKVLVEVGYEFNSYINTIGHFRFNDGRGTGMANCYNYNLDGVYISVKAMI